MKTNDADFKTLALGFVLLFIIIAGVAWIVVKIFGELQSVPWPFIGILLGVSSAISAWVYQFRIKIREEQREQKTKLYSRIIGFFFGIVNSSKEEGQHHDLEEYGKKFFVEITPDLIMWGSDDVVKYFRQFRIAAINQENMKLIMLFEKILLSIRKDLGHSNKDISNGRFLLGLFINDIDTYEAT